MKNLLAGLFTIILWIAATILQEQVFNMITPWVMVYGYVVGTIGRGIFDLMKRL